MSMTCRYYLRQLRLITNKTQWHWSQNCLTGSTWIQIMKNDLEKYTLLLRLVGRRPISHKQCFQIQCSIVYMTLMKPPFNTKDFPCRISHCHCTSWESYPGMFDVMKKTYLVRLLVCAHENGNVTMAGLCEKERECVCTLKGFSYMI